VNRSVAPARSATQTTQGIESTTCRRLLISSSVASRLSCSVGRGCMLLNGGTEGGLRKYGSAGSCINPYCLLWAQRPFEPSQQDLSSLRVRCVEAVRSGAMATCPREATANTPGDPEHATRGRNSGDRHLESDPAFSDQYRNLYSDGARIRRAAGSTEAVSAARATSFQQGRWARLGPVDRGPVSGPNAAYRGRMPSTVNAELQV